MEMRRPGLVKNYQGRADTNSMKHSRIARAVPSLMLAMLVSIWLAPAAHAQLGGGIGDAVGGVGGTIDTTVGGVTDGLEGGSSDSSTEDGGEKQESGGGLIGGIVEEVEKAVDNSKETVDGVAEETGDALGNVGSETVGGTVDTVEKTLGGVDGATGKNKKHRTAGSEESSTTTTSPVGDRVVVLGNSLADALEADAKAMADLTSDGVVFASASEAAPEEGLVSQLGKIATEALEQAAFPLALTLMVIAFLMVQNRLDRKDPKLALAPVDSEQDLLSFT